MRELKLQRRIDAPPARVFQVFSDFEHAPQYVRGIHRLELTTPGPVGVGTRFRETRIVWGRECTVEMEVTEFDAGSGYALACDSGGVRMVVRTRVAPDGATTRVTMEFSIEARSFFAKLMKPLAGMMQKQCAKAMEKELDDLQRVCEAVPARS